MKKYQKIIGVLGLTYAYAALSACAQATLKDSYADEFLIGTIMPGGLDPDATFTDDPIELGVVARDFNALTAENCMKPMFMQPNEGEYFFKASDFCVDFAEANSMVLVKSCISLRSCTNTVAFTNKALVILISLGDFLIGCYLLSIAFFDTIVYKNLYCINQIYWISCSYKWF